ncbi:hypothetical protein ACC697_38135, partial [Rhizobium ruizarguesonis]
IVAGISEGRASYRNIRKVVLMSVSTGAAEVLLFMLALPFGLPMPLLPVLLSHGTYIAEMWIVWAASTLRSRNRFRRISTENIDRF